MPSEQVHCCTLSGRRRRRRRLRIAASFGGGVVVLVRRGERCRGLRRELGCCPLHAVLQSLRPLHTLIGVPRPQVVASLFVDLPAPPGVRRCLRLFFWRSGARRNSIAGQPCIVVGMGPGTKTAVPCAAPRSRSSRSVLLVVPWCACCVSPILMADGLRALHVQGAKKIEVARTLYLPAYSGCGRVVGSQMHLERGIYGAEI